MKKFLLLFLFLSTFVYAQTSAKVIGISDGDTITVLLKGNTKKKLRLAEVDCPEKGQPYGKNARQFTSDQVFGKQVSYKITDTDRYGRSVAKIYYGNGKYLSAEIIKSGFGWWYYNYSKDQTLSELERKARAKKLGLWQDKKALSPWEFRKIKREKSKQKNKIS